MLAPHHNLGARGEALAAHWLQKHGYRIVARNWRAKQLELDIVVKHADTLVFVEVKTRSQGGMGSPVEAINPRKKNSLIKAARAYLAAHDAWHSPSRFDVIAIMLLSPSAPAAANPAAHTSVVMWEGATFSVEHYPHAFDLSSALDCGNTTWQPW